MLNEFDSRKTQPLLIFLGLDESRKEEGLSHKIYSGIPYFALDVTPKGPQEHHDIANEIVSAMESKGLSFFKTRVIMTFPADEGTSTY